METVTRITEKYENQNRDETKLLAQVDTSNEQNKEARIKTVFYLIEKYYKSFKVSIQTIIEGIRPVVSENDEVEVP